VFRYLSEDHEGKGTSARKHHGVDESVLESPYRRIDCRFFFWKKVQSAAKSPKAKALQRIPKTVSAVKVTGG